MEATIKEVSAILRSTEPMAAQFVERVQQRAKVPVSPAQILAAMQKISVKTLTLDKVVNKAQELHEKDQRKAERLRVRRQKRAATAAKKAARTKAAAAARALKKSAAAAPAADKPVAAAPAPDKPVAAAPAKTASTREPKTLLEKLLAVLEKNWDRAEAEGLGPDRMSAQAFIDAVYGYTDRREASRKRILQAAKQLDQKDVLLTPALVADVVHELFQA